MKINSLITKIGLLISCFFSLNVLAGQFEIRPIVDQHMPNMWQSCASLFSALQPYAVHEGIALVKQNSGVVNLSAIKEVASRIISQPDFANYIEKKFPTVKQNVEAILVAYMKKVVHVHQGSLVDDEAPIEDMNDDEYSHLSEPQKYLVKLLWNAELTDRTEIAKNYMKEFGIRKLNTAFGHISVVYQKVPGLKEFRQSLRTK